jgi:hypothetical protein
MLGVPRWIAWELSPVPYGDDPNDIRFDSVEETIVPNDHFKVRQLWELRNLATRIRVFLQSRVHGRGVGSHLEEVVSSSSSL